ncbi:MAG TPA: MbtH family NRPS accessory protein [Streptosporangiaceae bacterium]|nr:MbtH family NRPS accessory protein [Streptosporangiaceae bacterium]
MDDSEDDGIEYVVVINDEERYSIWWAHRDPPAGWHPTGFRGKKAACLAHIDEVWTDMRPKSLRERMQASGS